MLKKYLESYFQDIDLGHIFTDIVGTNDPKKIQPLIDNSINEYLTSEVDDILFIQSSIGVVFGFLLTSGDKIVLKVYSPKIPKNYLDKMNFAQNILYQENFPAPNILSEIFSFGGTFAGLYSLIEGEKQDAHQPLIRAELAKYLAEFSIIVDKHQLPPLENFFQQAMGNRLWPIPHNVLFNLKKTGKGAGWIAKKAKSARKILNSTPLPKRLAHTDWGVKNAIFNNNKLVGIFDWDSLGAMSEPEMVGRAAAQFTADWESGFKITPTANESRSFVETYQQYRKKEFNDDEFKVVSAAADSIIAIIARFEHAGGGEDRPYQELLRECGDNSFLYS